MLKQIAINSNTYHGFSLDEAVKGAREAGFKQIELAAVRDHTSHVLPDMSQEQLERTKLLLKEYGMTCIGISSHSNVMREDGVVNLVQGIDLAVEFDCKYVTTATGDSHGDTDFIAEETIVVENLLPAIEKCEQLNKLLVIETHGNNYATGRDVQKLVKALDNRVKINYDTGNVIFYGNTEPYEDLKASVDDVGFIHLKDKAGEADEWNFPSIGDGDLDYETIFGILKKANYKGPISVEIEFTPSGPANITEVNESVAKSFDYLTKILGS